MIQREGDGAPTFDLYFPADSQAFFDGTEDTLINIGNVYIKLKDGIVEVIRYNIRNITTQ